jgi:hypothetical protein
MSDESRTARYIRHLDSHVIPNADCYWCRLEQASRDPR